MSTVQRVAEITPSWVNWAMIVGNAALAWIQPVAGAVAIAWGLLQIYLAIEKRWFRNKGVK